MAALTYRERRMLLYFGMPAAAVATVERMTVHEVLELRAGLKARGLLPCTPGVEQAPVQLTFDGAADLMRSNEPAPGL